MTKKLKLDQIQIKSFVTSGNSIKGKTADIQGGGTGNQFFITIPINSCSFGNCTDLSVCVCDSEFFTCDCPA